MKRSTRIVIASNGASTPIECVGVPSITLWTRDLAELQDSDARAYLKNGPGPK